MQNCHLKLCTAIALKMKKKKRGAEEVRCHDLSKVSWLEGGKDKIQAQIFQTPRPVLKKVWGCLRLGFHRLHHQNSKFIIELRVACGLCGCRKQEGSLMWQGGRGQPAGEVRGGSTLDLPKAWGLSCQAMPRGASRRK